MGGLGLEQSFMYSVVCAIHIFAVNAHVSDRLIKNNHFGLKISFWKYEVVKTTIWTTITTAAMTPCTFTVSLSFFFFLIKSRSVNFYTMLLFWNFIITREMSPLLSVSFLNIWAEESNQHAYLLLASSFPCFFRCQKFQLPNIPLWKS